MNRDPTKELLRMWLGTLMDGLATEVDEKTRGRLMERCGRACARYHRSIERAQAHQREARDLDGLLAGLNQEDLWCGEWVREGDTIYSICAACGCPLVRAGFVEPSPAFCECSRAWVQAVFEAILERPPMVELRQAIGRGDAVCEFVVGLDGRPGR